MTKRIPVVISEKSATAFFQEGPLTVDDSNPNFREFVDLLHRMEYDKAQIVGNRKRGATMIAGDVVTVSGNKVFYGSMELRGSLVDRILELKLANHDFEPMRLFLENCLKNPLLKHDELFEFLEHSGGLPITEDGCFLAYKKVRPDYYDIYSGRMLNKPGEWVSMPREDVDPDRRNECSTGLHFCSFGYLDHYASYQDYRIVVVKINPADVIAIPRDYSCSKGRTFQYLVVDEISRDRASVGWDDPVVKAEPHDVDGLHLDPPQYEVDPPLVSTSYPKVFKTPAELDVALRSWNYSNAVVKRLSAIANLLYESEKSLSPSEIDDELFKLNDPDGDENERWRGTKRVCSDLKKLATWGVVTKLLRGEHLNRSEEDNERLAVTYTWAH